MSKIIQALEKHIEDYKRRNYHEYMCGGYVTCSIIAAKEECLLLVEDQLTKESIAECMENSDAEHF